MSDNIIVIINQSHSQSQSESESESPFRKLFGLNCNCIIRNYVEIVLIACAREVVKINVKVFKNVVAICKLFNQIDEDVTVLLYGSN